MKKEFLRMFLIAVVALSVGFIPARFYSYMGKQQAIAIEVGRKMSDIEWSASLGKISSATYDYYCSQTRKGLSFEELEQLVNEVSAEINR